MDSKNRPKNRNRDAGKRIERKYAALLKSVFPHIVRSAGISVQRDKQKKVDLMNSDEDSHGRLPFNIQVKQSVKTINYTKIYDEIDATHPRIIIHDKTEKIGDKFRTTHQFVIMSFDTFKQLLEQNEN